MAGDELSEEQSAQLKAVFERAGSAVPVPDRSFDRLLTPIERRSNRQRGRWLVAAAVAVLLAGGAGFWWRSHDGVEHVETAGVGSTTVEPPVHETVDPLVVEQKGIWRLPTDLAGHRVVDATSTSTAVPVLFAVDDPEAPTRWISFARTGAEISVGDRAKTVDLGPDVSLVLRPADAGSGMDGVTQYGLVSGSGSPPYVTGMFHGIDERSVVDMFKRAFPDGAALSRPAEAASTLAGIQLPEGIHRTWGADGDLTGGLPSLQLTLMEDTGAEVLVGLQSTGLPPAVVELRVRLVAAGTSNRSGSGSDTERQEIRRRPDLGRNVLEKRMILKDGKPAPVDVATLMVIADDGTIITAQRLVRSGIGAALPLSRDRQVEIINSLRAMDEVDLRAKLAASGVDHVDPSTQEVTPGSVTTIQGEQGSQTTTTRP